MRLLHKNPNTVTVGHDGVEYQRDEHGAFELPHDLAEHLLERFSHLWEIAPDPAPATESKPKRGAKAKPETATGDDSGTDDSEPKDPADSAETETPAATTEQPQAGDSTDATGAKPSRARKAAPAAQ